MENPEVPNGFFVATKERPAEAPFVANKKPFGTEDLKRKAGLASNTQYIYLMVLISQLFFQKKKTENESFSKS
ncbi:hypothetical protein B0A58_08575 [Flavobacterium branchiophilum NBRC 15030 = ATCC 35035]|uniref:hypothetical protein n=1 Tax=Flavobacterium branchiophilum TaxID=55197 RepID=UPI000B5BF331|nr:hypothetical protein [Flavobacterium branchiophilum]OXA75629.1 hypothetical protein B0A58_08575 [Flavobacterium branchiophilum NBRC 15030 = ATCC 35035]GEM55461.1 hypothetical protein FB1_16820 [Flavobacterium branchiophilum NBRC 15030 = ATCC 35035]